MVRDRPVCFAWGPVLLASLYRDLHEYMYMDDRALEAGVTLPHVWAWEHIVVLRQRVVSIMMVLDDPLVWRYKGCVSFTHTSEHRIPYWRRVLDEMQVFTLRPYLGQPGWADNADQLFYAH